MEVSVMAACVEGEVYLSNVAGLHRPAEQD